MQVDNDPTCILSTPINEVISIALANTKPSFGDFIEKRPFEGLVMQRPARALGALAYAARWGDYPGELWRSAVEHWPKDANERLKWLFGARLARLPSSVVLELRYVVFRWLQQHLPILFASDSDRALTILDALVDSLFDSGEEATISARGDTIQQGQPLNLSRRTIEHAINGPVGEIAELLLDLLNSISPKAGSLIPEQIRTRLQRLFAAPGEGSDHAICIVAKQFLWLDYVDPQWTKETILPWFSLDDPAAEPAWNGYLQDTRLPRPDLFIEIREHFLEAVIHGPKWNWEGRQTHRLLEFLIQACFLYRDRPNLITFDDVRSAMRRTDDAGRAYCIWILSRIVGKSEDWKRFVCRFLEGAWPREVRLQTEATSKSFVRLAEESGDYFPQIVNAIIPFLIPISEGELFFHSTMSENTRDQPSIATKFPEDTLTLLDKTIPVHQRIPPYGLVEIVEMIAQASPRLRHDPRWRRLNDIIHPS